MVFDNILQLQRQLTDKYVVVDAARPELRRFTGMTGVVKTVNFSGRALVQFDANNNIGWFDIDPRFLKVIDAPLPPPAAKEPKAEKKAAPIKTDKPAAAKPIGETPAKPAPGSVADILAAARGGAKPAAPAAPKSTAEILAAARTKPAEGSAPAAPAKVDPAKMSVADMLAAARGQKPAASAAPAASAPAAKAPAAPAKLDPKQMSVADMLAAARGQKPAAATPASPPAEALPPEPAAATPVEVAPIEETPAEEIAARGPTKVDRSTMDVPAILAYCRKADNKA